MDRDKYLWGRFLHAYLREWAFRGTPHFLTQKAVGHHPWDGSSAVRQIALSVQSEPQQNISFFSEMLSNWHLQDHFKISAHSSNRREGQLQVRLLSKTLCRAMIPPLHRAAFLIKPWGRQELTCNQRWSSFLYTSQNLWERSQYNHVLTDKKTTCLTSPKDHVPRPEPNPAPPGLDRGLHPLQGLALGHRPLLTVL